MRGMVQRDIGAASAESLRPALNSVVAGLFFLWPAFLSGFPLLFPDSIPYLGQGHGILAKLRGLNVPGWQFDSLRSEIFSISLVFLHDKAWLWPIVTVQALLLSWIVWMCMRAVCGRQAVAYYLATAASLALLTEAAWYASFVMPDIWGPMAYLAFFLLILVPDRLGRWQTVVLAGVSFIGVTAHGSHLLVAAALCAVLTLLWMAGWTRLRVHGRNLLLCTGVIVVALAAEEAIHLRLYGQASVAGHAPAFLTARLLGDGPARLYLQQHCAGSTWVLCQSAGHLPTTEGDFLWNPTGIWQSANPAQREQIRREQMPLLLATLRAYPRQQLESSLQNFAETLVTFGPAEFGSNSLIFTPEFLDFGANGLSKRYAGDDAVPRRDAADVLHSLQLPVMAASLALVAALLPGVWRRGDRAALGLAAVVLFSVTCNAFVCGVLSGVYPRYQGRVAWMLTMLAAVLSLTTWGGQSQAEMRTRFDTAAAPAK